jgi:uncharacterized protein YhaN
MGDIKEFPILIDDGFVNFDLSRKKEMLSILKSTSKKFQVFYFTTVEDSELSKMATIKL